MYRYIYVSANMFAATSIFAAYSYGFMLNESRITIYININVYIYICIRKNICGV